jgi:hypothetical protein
MQVPVIGPEGVYLCCYTCGGIASLDDGQDLVADRPVWPDMECPFTPGCPGRLVPEALN